MDPIMVAMRLFADEAEAFWRAHPTRVLPLLVGEEQREELVPALRRYEARPENRRPFVVFSAPFESASSYFAALAEQIAGDYERVRAGVADEGVELPSFTAGDEGTAPSGALKRAVLAMHKAARLLGDPFEGIVVALAPGHVADAAGWREGIRVLAGLQGSPRVRVAVLAPPGGPLSEVLEPVGASLRVDAGELLAFLGDVTPDTPDGDGLEPVDESRRPARARLRCLLLRASEALGASRPLDAAGLYSEARMLCQSEGMVTEEAAVLMAIGGVCLTARAPELAADYYQQAAGLAEQIQDWTMVCQAWLGAGGAHLARGEHVPAVVAFRAAGRAAEAAGVVPLRIESLRLAGTSLLQLGCEDEAMLAWKEAVDVGVDADAPERGASSFQDVARALVELLRRHGLMQQALHVQALLEMHRRNDRAS